MAVWLSLHGRVARQVVTMLCLLLFVRGVGALSQEPALLDVTAVRFWPGGDSTRVAIEVSGEFTYRHDRLAGPDRLYFDILESKPNFTKQLIHSIPVSDRLLKQIRVSRTQINVTRVVLDLEQPVDFSVVQLANPNRLMIELRPKAGGQQIAPVPPAAPDSQTLQRAAMAAKAVRLPAETAGLTADISGRSGTSPAENRRELPAVVPETPKPADDRIPLPAKKSAGGNRSLLRTLGLKLQRVVIDPGHGGHDTGTIGPAGLMEKDLVLDVARRLGALIEERLGAEVVYTRTEDVFVPLEERTALANEREADLFLSIHANSGVASATGTETYYLNFTTSKSAMDVAARENASSQRSIYELQSLIEKIALKDKVDESREFAGKVQASLVRELGRTNSASRDRGVRKAPFVVLIGASMPSVLSEIAFLSNPREERLLKRDDYRRRIAEGLLRGVSQYASTLSRFQLAEQKKP